MSFNAKSVIVTGATSGIGRSAAEAFGREAAQLVLVGRNQAALDDLVAGVNRSGARAVACLADVPADDAAERIVGRAVEEFGGLDVLVNAAGVIASGTLEATTDQTWDAMMSVNVRAPFRLMRAAAPHLVARKGTVVNVSSVNGMRSFPGVLAY